jgi:metallo-beta-lactamase family protein
MKITFCGAAREVTGSCHLITLNNGFKILLDCGLYQGHSKAMEDFNANWHFNPSEIDVLILSHAHIDHTGRVPKLVKDGFKGKIFSNSATRDLCAYMLLDSGRIQESDAAYENKQAVKKGLEPNIQPLYTTDDVSKALSLFVTNAYETWFNIHPDVAVRFTDAGHILGSASVALTIKENGKTTRLGFSGDIGRPNRPILRDPQPMTPLDFLLCESTYGDCEHHDAPEQLEKFLSVITNTCVTKKGKIIIPAFSVGRTQEIVYMIDQLVSDGKFPLVPVYVDSPLAVNATDVFIAHPECFDEEMHAYMLKDPNPFGFRNLSYIRTLEDSKAINDKPEPCVIISSSGMANAGRIQHHIANNIGNPNNTILIVGYCSPETPGGHLRAGAKNIRLFGDTYPVKASVEVMDSFSAHGDRKEMLGMIANQKTTVQNIWLVHGELEKQLSFVKFLDANGFQHVDIPAIGDTVEIKGTSFVNHLTGIPSVVTASRGGEVGSGE